MALYFFSRVPVFTPVTASYIPAEFERIWEASSEADLSGRLAAIRGVDTPENFDRLAQADQNHAAYWSQCYVHRLDAGIRFLNLDEDRRAALFDLLMHQPLDQDYSFSDHLARFWIFDLLDNLPDSALHQRLKGRVSNSLYDRLNGLSTGVLPEGCSASYDGAEDQLIADLFPVEDVSACHDLSVAATIFSSSDACYADSFVRAMINNVLPHLHLADGFSEINGIRVNGQHFLYASEGIRGAHFAGNVEQVLENILCGTPLDDFGPSDRLSNGPFEDLRPGRHEALKGLTNMDRAFRHYDEVGVEILPPDPERFLSLQRELCQKTKSADPSFSVG